MQCAENEVSGQAGIRGDTRCFQVANLANHNDVRRLAQNRTQRGGKGHANLWIHRYLVDAGHLIFDRLFYGDDLAVWFVDVMKTGIKRSRLAGASWPCDK